MNLFVTGGTGVIGLCTVRRLLAAGHTVKLFSRHASQDAKELTGDVHPIDGSVANQQEVEKALTGCEVVVHIAGIVSEKPPKATFQGINVDGTRFLVEAAETSGVQRFIYISSLGADRGSSNYHRSKLQAEEIVKRFTRDWLILRPSVVYGEGDEVVSLLLQMIRTLPAIPVIDGGDTPSQPMWAEDFAEAVLQAVEVPELHHQTLECAGAERVSMNQMLDRLSDLTGVSPLRIPMPSWLASTGAQLLQTAGLDLPFSPDQVQMLVEGNTIPEGHRNALIETFGITPTPLATGLQRIVAGGKERAVLDGVGDLHRNVYTGIIEGSNFSAEDLFKLFVAEMAGFFPPAVEGDPEDRGERFALGETITLRLPARGNIQVRVVELTSNHATCATLDGHPLVGTVEFSCGYFGDRIAFTVTTTDRASNLIDKTIMDTLGRGLQDLNWTEFIQAVAARSGGRLVDEVDVKKNVLSGTEAREVEQQQRDLISSFRKDQHGQATMQ